MLEKQSGSICAIRNISASLYFEPIHIFVHLDRFYGTSKLKRSLCKYFNILAAVRLLIITNNTDYPNLTYLNYRPSLTLSGVAFPSLSLDCIPQLQLLMPDHLFETATCSLNFSFPNITNFTSHPKVLPKAFLPWVNFTNT